jgi:hypothetical protein
MQTVSQPQRTFPEQARIPGPSRAAPNARDKILHSKPWQYAGKSDGRKFRILRERDRRLARALARIDWSGECQDIFAAVSPPLGQMHSARGKSILEQLRKAELNYPTTGKAWQRQMKWSRPTVYRHLARLRSAGSIETLGGLSHYHGTRRRIMHPERLLSVPRESETPTRRESETGSKSLEVALKQEERPETLCAAKTAARSAVASHISNSNPQVKPSCPGNGQTKPRTVAGPLPSWTVEQLRYPSIVVRLLNHIAKKYVDSHDPELRVWVMGVVAWALRGTKNDSEGQRRIFHPFEYVEGCVENFLRGYPDYQAEAILASLNDLPGVHFNGRKWVNGDQPAPRVPRERPEAIEKARRREKAELERNRQSVQKKLGREQAELTKPPAPAPVAGPRGLSAKWDYLLKPEAIMDPDRRRQREQAEFDSHFAELARRGEAYCLRERAR